MNRPPAPPAPRVRPPAMPQRTAAVPVPRRPAADAAPPSPRIDRREVRRTAKERRRALATELRRPRARRVRAIPLVVAGAVVLLVAVPPVLAFAPVFTVQQVAVSGATGDVAAAVQQALAGERGRPIALVGDDDVRDALRSVAAVESASVVRRPPSTLEVRVVTRTPVAQRQAGGSWQQLDAAGIVIATSATRFAALPAVATTGGPRVYATVVAALAATAEAGLQVTQVRASGADDVVLRLARGPSVQWGGAEQSAAKAEALAAALKRAAKGATEIDVSSPGVVLTR